MKKTSGWVKSLTYGFLLYMHHVCTPLTSAVWWKHPAVCQARDRPEIGIFASHKHNTQTTIVEMSCHTTTILLPVVLKGGICSCDLFHKLPVHTECTTQFHITTIYHVMRLRRPSQPRNLDPCIQYTIFAGAHMLNFAAEPLVLGKT